MTLVCDSSVISMYYAEILMFIHYFGITMIIYKWWLPKLLIDFNAKKLTFTFVSFNKNFLFDTGALCDSCNSVSGYSGMQWHKGFFSWWKCWDSCQAQAKFFPEILVVFFVWYLYKLVNNTFCLAFLKQCSIVHNGLMFCSTKKHSFLEI